MKGNKTMNTYLITNNKDIRDHFEKDFENVSNAKDWIINHLDISKQWSINQATKKAKKKLDFDCAVEHMKRTFNKGDTIYTQLIKSTPNGTIYIRLRYIKDNRPYQCTYHYSKIMDHKLDENNGYSIRRSFGNMDMGFQTVYELCSKVWNDGYYCNHKWL
jgi:hypothetical protein